MTTRLATTCRVVVVVVVVRRVVVLLPLVARADFACAGLLRTFDQASFDAHKRGAES